MLSELHTQGRLVGVFSTDDAAKRFMESDESRYKGSSYSMLPFGTTLKTDIGGFYGGVYGRTTGEAGEQALRELIAQLQQELRERLAERLIGEKQP
jgi:hypothetical protein